MPRKKRQRKRGYKPNPLYREDNWFSFFSRAKNLMEQGKKGKISIARHSVCILHIYMRLDNGCLGLSREQFWYNIPRLRSFLSQWCKYAAKILREDVIISSLLWKFSLKPWREGFLFLFLIVLRGGDEKIEREKRFFSVKFGKFFLTTLVCVNWVVGRNPFEPGKWRNFRQLIGISDGWLKRVDWKLAFILKISGNNYTSTLKWWIRLSRSERRDSNKQTMNLGFNYEYNQISCKWRTMCLKNAGISPKVYNQFVCSCDRFDRFVNFILKNQKGNWLYN